MTLRIDNFNEKLSSQNFIQTVVSEYLIQNQKENELNLDFVTGKRWNSINGKNMR